MKKLILLLTVIGSLTYAEGLDVGTYFLVREGEHGLHDSKVSVATVYIENGSKLIHLDGWLENTPLKIEFEKEDTFIFIVPIEAGYESSRGRDLITSFTGTRESKECEIWKCDYHNLRRNSSNFNSRAFLLIPKDTKADKSGNN